MTINIKKIISAFCCIVLAIAFVCPTEVFAKQYNEYQSDRQGEQLDQYLQVVDGRLSFDEETAFLQGESSELIAVGEKVEEIAKAYSDYHWAQQQGVDLYGITLPIYGNYCGPGTESNAGQPIDYADAQCQIHDDCYYREGYFACPCDQELVDRLNAKLDKMSGDQLTFAQAAIIYFNSALNNPTDKGSIVPPSCATNPN